MPITRLYLTIVNKMRKFVLKHTLRKGEGEDACEDEVLNLGSE